MERKLNSGNTDRDDLLSEQSEREGEASSGFAGEGGDVSPSNRQRLPPWFKVKLENGPQFQQMKSLVKTLGLHTVCEEARCPNQWECWNRGTATFMILGDICTRSCGFCAVTTGKPSGLDWDEPRRVGRAVNRLGLNHAVITSVNRDELEDGGAGIFANTVEEVRAQNRDCTIEVLIPDFQGSYDALLKILDVKPDILNHNLETVPRLYSKVRPQAKYSRSMEVLDRSKKSGLTTKTGIMVGLGETLDEIKKVMEELVLIQCDIMTIGQYLQPTKDHLPVERYYAPEEFIRFKELGEKTGIPHVESGPLVRSSYHADDQAMRVF
ncbi:MAG: lipoyl synthase [Nitrospirae bacterium]|nr:lipoyl synthase [Nitrospirota bacterium]MBI3352020.1 lipoyl synthase [Nitrospirota bacterium]